MSNICMYFIVEGKVQGVWYRASTQEEADRLGLTGWVRNTSDGKVELVACGGQQKILELEKWLWQGPPAARVTNVISKKIDAEVFSGFEIK